MREIKINGKTIGVKASPLTLLFYKQQFKTDLLNDLITMQKGKKVEMDTVKILQIGWALNKSYVYPQNIPSFMTWMENLGVVDPELLKMIMEEAKELFVKDKPSYQNKASKKKR